MKIGELFYVASAADRVQKGESTWLREILFYFLCVPAFLLGVAGFMFIGIGSWFSLIGGVLGVVLLQLLLSIPRAIGNAIRRAQPGPPEEHNDSAGERMNFCPNCGKQLEGDARNFCPKCGKALSAL